MIRSRDGSASAQLLTDRPILVESRGSFNGRLIDTLVQVDVVSSSVALDGAFVGPTGRRVVVVPGLDDVVFYEGVGEPAVDREVAAAVGAVVGGVGDIAGGKIVSVKLVL